MANQKTHLYLIREKSHGWHKIGITSNWDQRCKQLAVGSKTEKVLLVRVHNANQLEKRLHKRFDAVRLPQTEWFNLDGFQLAAVEAAFQQAADNYQAALNAKRQQQQQQAPRPTQPTPAPAPAPAVKPAPLPVKPQPAPAAQPPATSDENCWPEMLSAIAVSWGAFVLVAGCIGGIAGLSNARQWAVFSQNCSQENLAKLKANWGVQAAINQDIACRANTPGH